MLITLGEARESGLRNVAGSCPNSDQFLEILNDATRKLMRRGDWPGTVTAIQVCTHGGCVVWPRYVGEVRKINLCGQQADIKNGWYQFMPFVGGCRGDGTNWWGNQSWGASCGAPAVMINKGKSPVFQDIQGEGRLVRAYATAHLDLGKTVRIFGIDNNGQILRTRNSDGTYSDGWPIVLASPFGSSPDFVRIIERVLVAKIQSEIRLYAYNADTDLLEDVATYEPGDTNPAFQKYGLDFGYRTPGTGGCGATSCCSSSVIALVKLKFIPARTDNDLVLIENLDALEMMIQSIKYRRAGDSAGALESESAAIRELNLGLNDASPLLEIPIANLTFGRAPLGRQKMF